MNANLECLNHSPLLSQVVLGPGLTSGRRKRRAVGEGCVETMLADCGLFSLQLTLPSTPPSRSGLHISVSLRLYFEK
jgi:hypothetical protein